MAPDDLHAASKADAAATRPAGDIDTLAINTIRTLAIDAVAAADSGHAGLPMGMAPVGWTLWKRFLRYDPDTPDWPGRDRFVLSAGHGSMLLYALLFLARVKRPDGSPAVSLDDIKAFRQLHSVCPGHPEHGVTVGVETTTGPLGQGVANSVGMAIAQRWLAARFDRPGHTLFDYDVYALCSDGDLMEGVSGEAASLAGHLRLSNLCWLYDDNHVSIEGSTDLAFTEDVTKRFQGYGWAVLSLPDANDCEAVASAIETFRATPERPTLIRIRSTIGYGAPTKAGTSKIHSDPLGEEEAAGAKRFYGWPPDARFLVPDGVRDEMDAHLGVRGRRAHAEWEAAFARYAEEHPADAAALKTMWAGELPAGWDADLPAFEPDAKGLATREASGKALTALAQRIPWLVGGAGDLAPSTKTLIEGGGDFEPGGYGGRNLRFGVREHGMAGAANGMALSGLRPYVGTFLTFSDYMRPSIRLAALMDQPVTYVFTHDSIGLGEDGPTHQPIEQLPALRAIPNLSVIRPCDANETVQAWRMAMGRRGPTALVLSRQALPTLDRTRFADARGLARGAYVLSESGGGEPRLILIGAGSEVRLCLEAQERLRDEGVRARVVSMPSFDLFEAQDEDYRHQVLPPQISARVAVEAAAPLGWDRYVGPTGAVIAMHGFGTSAPGKDAMAAFGFTVEAVCAAAKAQLERRS